MSIDNQSISNITHLTDQFLGLLRCLRSNINYEAFTVKVESEVVEIIGFTSVHYLSLKDLADYFGTDNIQPMSYEVKGPQVLYTVMIMGCTKRVDTVVKAAYKT